MCCEVGISNSRTVPGNDTGQPPACTMDSDVWEAVGKLCATVFNVRYTIISLLDGTTYFRQAPSDPSGELSADIPQFFWTPLPCQSESVVVEDTVRDARFAEVPLVTGPPYIRFYAGCPLKTEAGLRLGDLCIFDTKTRTFDHDAQSTLAHMAGIVVREIEKQRTLEQERQRARHFRNESNHLLKLVQNRREGLLLCDVSIPAWPILFVNEAWSNATGLGNVPLQGCSFWDSFQVGQEADGLGRDALLQAVHERQAVDTLLHFTGAGQRQAAQVHLDCASNVGLLEEELPLTSSSGRGAEQAPLAATPMLYVVSMRSTHAAALPPPSSGADSAQSGFVRPPSKMGPLSDLRLGHTLGGGNVIKGWWNETPVAVKVVEDMLAWLPPGDGLQCSPTDAEIFLNSDISHPHVVQIFAAQGRERELWLVQEYCDKGNLREAVRQGCFELRPAPPHLGTDPGPGPGPDSSVDAGLTTTGPHPARNVPAMLATAAEVAGAMSYLHSRGIVHGSLCADNVLLTTSDKDSRAFTAKVYGFHLSRVLTRGAGSVLQQCGGGGEDAASRAADVHAFGLLLYEMCCPCAPPARLMEARVAGQVTEEAGPDHVPDADHLQQHIPPHLAALIMACLAPAAAGRPQFPQILDKLSALEQQLELEACMQELGPL